MKFVLQYDYSLPREKDFKLKKSAILFYFSYKMAVSYIINLRIFAANGDAAKKNSDLAFIHNALLKQYMILGISFFYFSRQVFDVIFPQKYRIFKKRKRYDL